jgi:hypothetical protein
MNKFGLLEKLSLLSMNKLIPMLPFLQMASQGMGSFSQQQPPMDMGYNPTGQLQGQMQEEPQGLGQQLLQGGAQGLGSLLGNQLGGSGLDILGKLGQGFSGKTGGNSLTKLLEMIPEEEIRRFLESRQMAP